MTLQIPEWLLWAGVTYAFVRLIAHLMVHHLKASVVRDIEKAKLGR
jgi:hypothetical protein